MEVLPLEMGYDLQKVLADAVNIQQSAGEYFVELYKSPFLNQG